MSIKVFQHLLPKAKAWTTTIEKNLRGFFEGLSVEPDDTKVFIDQVWEDIDPQRTRELELWEEQWNLITSTDLTEQERRDRLDATWKALGGQSPRYIEDTLRGAGFDVYVHEWWSSRFPYVARDPNTVTNLQYMIQNVEFVLAPNFVALCGKANALSGEADIQCNNSVGFVTVRVDPPIPSDPNEYPYILYIGGETFGDLATVVESRRSEFETLLKKICPAQQWLGMIVTYV